jgi:hypothetical protein
MKNLKDFLEHNEKALAYQNSLPVKEQIEFLKSCKKSVFTFHMKDGRKIIKGDSVNYKKEMQEFFKTYPQNGCERIEFHK